MYIFLPSSPPPFLPPSPPLCPSFMQGCPTTLIIHLSGFSSLSAKFCMAREGCVHLSLMLHCNTQARTVSDGKVSPDTAETGIKEKEFLLMTQWQGLRYSSMT